MHKGRAGMAGTAIAVIVIVVIVVAGVAAYSLTRPSSSSSSSSTTSFTSAPPTSTTTTSAPSTLASSSSGSTTTASCTSASAPTSSQTASMVPLLNAYSGLSMNYLATANGLTDNTSSSYTTVYDSSTTYKISLSYTSNGQSTPATLWILKNGTLLAVNQGGQNVTGPLSSEILTAYLAGFAAEAGFSAVLSTYTSPSSFHSTGTSSVTIGPTKFTVTTYAANSLPVTVSPCGATPLNLTTFSLSEGTPSGASTPLVTSLNLAGSETVNGQSVSVEYSITLTSITVG